MPQAAKRLSDVLPGSGACCHLPRRPALAAVPLMQPAGQIWLLEHPVLQAPNQESALAAGSCFAVQVAEPAPHRVGAHLQL